MMQRQKRKMRLLELGYVIEIIVFFDSFFAMKSDKFILFFLTVTFFPF